MTIREIVTETAITPQLIHQLADRKGIEWDNDADFMRLTQQLTGKRHLDDLDSAQLRKVYNHINQNLSEGKPRGGLAKWFREKWVNIAKKEGGKHPACGTSGETSGYAKCVPAKKAASMSAKEKKSAVNRKRSAQRKAGRPGKESGTKGKSPVRVKTAK